MSVKAPVAGQWTPANPVDVPVGIGVLAGIVLLLVSLAGLVLLFKALGLADNSAAFGLPSGSIRALLALGLVIAFVAVASEVLLNPTPNLPDGYKQVLTIAATTLSTVVGFYFGSNASTEAAKKMADNLAAQGNGNDGSSTSAAQAPSADQLAQRVTAIRSLANGAKAALDQLGDPSFDAVKRAAAAAPSANADVTKAQAAFDTLNKSLSALTTDADRAEAALQAWRSAGSDTSKLAPLAAQIGQYDTDSTTTNHAFMTALQDYKTERNAILKNVAPA